MSGNKKQNSIGASILRNLGRVGLMLVTFLAVIFLTLYFTMLMICNGNSPAARETFVNTILETGQLKFLASWYLSKAEINEVMAKNKREALNDSVDSSLIRFNEEITDLGNGVVSVNENDVDINAKVFDYGDDGVAVEKVAGRNFSAIMMIVKDPSRVSVSCVYPWGEYGKELDKIVKEADAIGGINGTIYKSDSNKGGHPIGIVVSQGEILMNEPWALNGLVMVGMTENGILDITDINKWSAADVEKYVKEKKIRDAVCFQEEMSEDNNHFVQLIINGVERQVSGSGSGGNPRTAIGQRADGALLLLVTDGRGADGHLGASASDLISIMKEYGAVNAANLDGGSSTCMYYDDEYLMTSVTFYYRNSSWRLPLAWVISKP